MGDAAAHRLRRLDADDAGRPPDRAARRTQPLRQAPPDRARARRSSGAVGKEGVLDRYLMLAPFGGNLEGVRAASLAYFGKEPRKLTIAEAALLVALPQAPECAPARQISRGRARARGRGSRARRRARRDRRATKRSAAEREPIPQRAPRFSRLAAHAAEEAVAADPKAHVIRLSIDARLADEAGDARQGERRAARAEALRRRSSPSTTRAARSAPASAPPIISTPRATARSTCRARRARRARR